MTAFILAAVFFVIGIVSFIVGAKKDYDWTVYVAILTLGLGIIYLTHGCSVNSYTDYHVEEIDEKYSITIVGDNTEVKIYQVTVKEVNSGICYVVEVTGDNISFYEDEYFRCKRKEFYNSYEKVVGKIYSYEK